MITDNMSVEKKNKMLFSIPFDESPKILISTNHVIQTMMTQYCRSEI